MFKTRDLTREYKYFKAIGFTVDEEQTKRIQEISLEICKDIFTMCEQNNLTVMLGGGSALGAVRHKGFIPWDDDIDLLMPRADYDKFIQLFESNLGDKYQLKAPTVKSRSNIFIQVLNPQTKQISLFHNPKWPIEGIAVDIFSLDYVPQNKLLYYIKGFVANLIVYIRASKIIYQGQTPISKQMMCQSFISTIYYYMRIALGFCMGWMSFPRLCSWFDKIVAGRTPAEYINIPAGRNHYFGERHRTDILLPPQKAAFEDAIFYIPNDCDTYLRKLYGSNYMQIPPVEKRERHLYTMLEI